MEGCLVNSERVRERALKAFASKRFSFFARPKANTVSL
jgi:hypothetical protein